jgi:cobalt/nickel transport system permease protein
MHHLQEFFSGRPTARRRLLAGCDVRIRLIVALAVIVAVVASTRIGFEMLVLAGCVAGMVAVRMPREALVCRLAGPLALAAAVCLVQTFMTGGTLLAGFDLGPWRLTATWEGFWSGALIACRILGSLGIIMLLCEGTAAEELFAACRWARAPRTWIEIAILMHRYLHLFFEQAVGVVAAQKTRLGYGRLRQSFRSMGNLAGMVMLRSLDQAERSHEAMVARGYQGFLPLPCLPPLPRRQVALGFVAVTILAATYLLAQRWPP